ncbi:DUF3253 domain-containing protein [Methyloversatilis thermotolerans]|uniref:DUF3253 domain-containing protein n=1 Tax=Methyloversatilis thermotolerans TaxID=1346290 RepID=UPI00039A0400|nr:DUF3253 domain-containing protein [Methyloversatilis thermotolerans]
MQRSGPSDGALIEQLRTALLALLAARSGGASICPSEVARACAADWRPLMPAVKDLARRLAREGLVVITQRGHPLDPDADWLGPIRVRLKDAPGRPKRP